MTRQVVVGEVAGAYGVKGWVKVHSFTDPPENILAYSPWSLAGETGSVELRVLAGRLHGQAVVAQLEGIEDRDQATSLKSREIAVPRERFPVLEEGKYYWADLIGLEVRTGSGVKLGKVAEMMATGANDVLVVQGDRERLIPFVLGAYIKEVSLDEGVLIADWDPDF